MGFTRRAPHGHSKFMWLDGPDRQAGYTDGEVLDLVIFLMVL